MTEAIPYPDDEQSRSSYQQAVDILDTVEATAGVLAPFKAHTPAAEEELIANDGVELAKQEHDRSKYIGGSDIAAIMGLSPWQTPFEKWQEKTHRGEREITPEKARIFRRGHKLEPFIREMTIEKLVDMGLDVELVRTNQRYIDPEVPYFAAEIDFELTIDGEVEINGEIVKFECEHVNVDAKSVTGFARKKWGDVGSDEVPIEYAAQFMWGLGITDRSYCLVAALRSFDDVDLFWVKADAETIPAMRAKAAQFWLEHVLKDTPPDPVNFSDLRALFEKPKAASVECDEAMFKKALELKRVKAAIKDLKETEEELAFEVARACGEAAVLTYGGKQVATWNDEAFSRLDQQALKDNYPEVHAACNKTGTHRVLRIKAK